MPIVIARRPRVRRLPTARPFPLIDADPHPIRLRLYDAAKEQPITAQTGALLTETSLATALDQLRILEEWRIIRHTANEAGVIYWIPVDDNVWEQPAPPF